MEISTIAMMGIAGVCLLAGKTVAWKKGISGRLVTSDTLQNEPSEQERAPLASTSPGSSQNIEMTKL